MVVLELFVFTLIFVACTCQSSARRSLALNSPTHKRAKFKELIKNLSEQLTRPSVREKIFALSPQGCAERIIRVGNNAGLGDVNAAAWADDSQELEFAAVI